MRASGGGSGSPRAAEPLPQLAALRQSQRPEHPPPSRSQDAIATYSPRSRISARQREAPRSSPAGPGRGSQSGRSRSIAAILAMSGLPSKEPSAVAWGWDGAGWNEPVNPARASKARWVCYSGPGKRARAGRREEPGSAGARAVYPSCRTPGPLSIPPPRSDSGARRQGLRLPGVRAPSSSPETHWDRGVPLLH